MPICYYNRRMSAKELKTLYGGKTRDEALRRMANQFAAHADAFKHAMAGFSGVVTNVTWEADPHDFTPLLKNINSEIGDKI